MKSLQIMIRSLSGDGLNFPFSIFALLAGFLSVSGSTDLAEMSSIINFSAAWKTISIEIINSRCRSSCLRDVSTSHLHSTSFDADPLSSFLTLYRRIKGAWFLFLIFYPGIIHDMVIIPEYICWPLCNWITPRHLWSNEPLELVLYMRG